MRIFIIILWLILGLIYYLIWDYGKDKCCGDQQVKTETVIEKTETTTVKKKLNLPLAFYWSKKEVVVGDGFKAYKDSVLLTLKDGQILEITGLYRQSEENTSQYDNLGLARANEIRKLFAEIPDNRIKLYGKQVEEKTGERTDPFSSAYFRSAVNNANVKEVNETALIYFPYNSTAKLDNRNIENYLDEVAERVKKTGEKIRLTGHTDSFGDRAYNYKLGKMRAKIIKDYLVSKGVPSNSIIVLSKGEDEPLKPNNTRENRAKNRRVELKILKQ